MGHFFDVQDEVTIGQYTSIGGLGSSSFTHQVNLASGTFETEPLAIGAYCMLGSNVHFAPGARVADYCAVGIGSVVTSAFDEPYTLIAGNPARVVKQLPANAGYFRRSRGWISRFTPWPFEA
jgi:acetyltransferase-like isoleucine patch superfamily enzyme